MDILTVLIVAFLIHTLDNMWVNWLNYRMATHNPKEERDGENNGVERIGFTQGYQLKDNGEEKEG